MVSKIEIENTIISLTKINDDDFICLTDMAKAKKEDNRAADIIKNWIRTRTTIEFLGTWNNYKTLILKWSNLTTSKQRLVYQLL